MPISIICSECQMKLQAPDTAAGKKIRCPACQTVIAVPEPEKLDELVEVDEATAVTEAPPLPPPPLKKAAWDDDTSPVRKRRDEDDDYEDDEDDDRPRRKKKRSRFDEDEDDDYGSRRRRIAHQPHRGVLILVLGIVSIFASCFCPLVAWVVGGYAINMSSADLNQMASRRMDSSGHGLTLAGKICGIVGVVLGFLVAIATYVFEFGQKLR